MYGKIFCQIFESSIVENPDVRFTFMDLIVLADQDGVVDMTHEAIARRTNRPLEVIKKTISELEGPDPRSRTPNHAGARIKRLDSHRDWGWMIINYHKFRQTASEEQRRAKTAERVRRFRERTSGTRKRSADVTLCNAGNAKQKHKQMYKHKHTDTDSGGDPKQPVSPPVISSIPENEQIYKAYPKQVGKQIALKAINKALKTKPFPELLEAVTAYAQAVAGQDPQYIPHPATWFNSGRYDDDRKEWQSSRSEEALIDALIQKEAPYKTYKDLTPEQQADFDGR